MSADSEAALRAALVEVMRGMAAHGLNAGTAGNASLRYGGGVLVSPSGMPAEQLQPDDIVWLDPADQPHGERRPSSEWRMHADLLRAHPEVGAVLHAHSPCATALACHGEPIPPFHYMILRFGGPDIRCAPYATYGSAELSAAAVAALIGRSACLLANHGMVVLGRDGPDALARAVEFEALCDHYWRACQLGTPRRLSAEQLAEVERQFAGYGQPDSSGH